MRIALLTKRHYIRHDLIQHRYGRFYHLPIQLAKAGESVEVWAADYQTWIDEAVELEGVSFHSFSAHLKGLEFLFGSVYRSIREYAPDVVIATGHTHLIAIGQWVAKRLGKPYIAECYDYYPQYSDGRFPGDARYFQHILNAASGVAFASAAGEAAFGRNANTIVLPNGVDECLFRPLDKEDCRNEFGIQPQEKVIFLMGSLEFDRGLGCLIEAYQILRGKIDNLRLIVAGSPGPRELQLPEGVTHCGMLPLEKLARLVNACDVGAAIYAKNPLNDYINSCKLAEYMSCEVPVVASRVGDCAFTLPSGFQGLCESDDVEGLARALEVQLIKPEIARLKESHSWESIADRLRTFLVRVCQSS